MAIAVIFPLVQPPFAARAGAGLGFAKIDNREVFLRAVEVYARRDQVVQRIVVVPPDDLQEIQERYAAHLGFQGVMVAGGTSDWFGCVERGLARLEEAEHGGAVIAESVIVHDPCCPVVGFPLLDAMEEALGKSGAGGVAGVVPVLPSRSAFADVQGKGISEYVDMAKVYEVQSPQIFRRKELVAAYAKRGDGVFVDDAELVMAAGYKVGTVAGSRFNQRIDSEEMVRLGKDLVGHLPKPKMKTPLNPFGEAEW